MLARLLFEKDREISTLQSRLAAETKAREEAEDKLLSWQKLICPDCHGQGKISHNDGTPTRCQRCGGNGFTKED